MTMTEGTDLARQLMSLGFTEFRNEVNADLRPGDGERWRARHAALRSPTVVDRWFTALSQMAKSVDGQLAARAEDYEAERAALRMRLLSASNHAEEKQIKRKLEHLKAEYSRSRAGTIRFKTGLDEALIEARALRDSVRDRLYDSVVAEERNRYATRKAALEDAIREHRDALAKADLDPEDHDLHLWALLDQE